MKLREKIKIKINKVLNDTNRKYVFAFAIIVALLGVIGELITVHNYKGYKYYDLSSGFCIGLIQLGLLSIAFGIFERYKYAEDKMKKVIFEDNACLYLDEKKRQNLKKVLEESLYDCENKNSLYKVVQEEILPLTENWFFEKYNSTVNISIENNKVIKDFEDVIIVNKSNRIKGDFQISWKDLLGFRCYSDSSKGIINDIDLEELIVIINNIEKIILKDKIKKIKIESKDLNNSNLQIKQYDACYYYDVDETLILANKPITIKLKYKSTVTNDFIYGKKIRKPCRNFAVNMINDENILDMIVVGFGFMDSFNNKNRLLTTKTNNFNRIEFNDWILPGDGFFVSIIPKNVSTNSNALNDKKDFPKQLGIEIENLKNKND